MPSPATAQASTGCSTDLDQSIVAKLKTVLGSISEQQAKTIMPPHYTGWVPATAATYQLIRDAGVAVGKLKVTN